MENLNRRINKLFLKIAQDIYASDIKNGDTKTWWPVRPTKIDYPLAPFIFSELIRLFKKAEAQGLKVQGLAKFFESNNVVWDFQFLWPSLGWKPTEISFEDKLYLVEQLILLCENLSDQEDFQSVYRKLGKETKEGGDASLENILKAGARIYLDYLKPLYEYLEEDWGSALNKAQDLVLTKQSEMQDPGPWGETSQEKALRKLVRNSDFRREKEKDLKEILQGVPEIPGIAQGVVGENIFVGFTIEELDEKFDAYITNIDAFHKQVFREELESKGVVVVSKTRSGTSQLNTGEKVWVDGTSGLVFTET